MPKPRLRPTQRTVAVVALLLLVVLVSGVGTYAYLRAQNEPAVRAGGQGGGQATAPGNSAEAGIRTSIGPTGLHWLAVTKMDYPLGHPMDVAQAGGRLFVVTRLGALTWLDPEAKTFQTISTIEQNRDALRASEIRDLEHFNLSWFRTFGLHVEQTGPSYRAYAAHHLFEDECFYFQVSRIEFSFVDDAVEISDDWRPIYTAEPCIEVKAEGLPFAGHQGGGRLVPYDEDHLLLSTGDYELDGNTGPAVPLDPDSPYGKILLLNKHSGGARVFASGLRNPQGLFVTAEGDIFATDHGPMGGDELNLILDGEAYGWPEETYGILYGRRPWPAAQVQGRHDRYRKPVFAWLPSVATSNLTQAGPGQFELWAGDLLVSSLKKETLYRLRMEDGRVMYVEPIEIGHRIRDLVTLDTGQIVLVTDDEKIIVLSDAGKVFEDNLKKPQVNERLPFVVLPPGEGETPDAVVAAAPAAPAARELFETKCASCHRLDGEIDVSVPLNGLFERQIGSVAGYDYSEALASDRRRWNPDLLRQFLLDGTRAFAGTTMPPVAISREETERLAAWLAGLEAGARSPEPPPS